MKTTKKHSFLTSTFWGAALGLGIAGIFGPTSMAQAETISYNFNIEEKTVNFTGKDVTAMSVGQQIPAPLIEATKGDRLHVTFNNKMDVETSIHWHGILLPPDQDGVPHLNTKSIASGKSLTFDFPITHHGTYWYHSHTGMQEQRGVYGPLVFHPEKESIQADKESVLVLSDWTDENPGRVMANLKTDADYYAAKKGNDTSLAATLKKGWPTIKKRVKSELSMMGPMDVSDVGYDQFLTNGQQFFKLPEARAGEKIRLRIINAGFSSNFNLQFAGGNMTIIAQDGVDVVPFDVDRQFIAVAETYDVIVTVPENGKKYEFRATAEDGTGFSSTLIGNGKQLVVAPTIPKPDPLAMDHSMHGAKKKDGMGDMDAMDHSTMNHHGHDMHNMIPQPPQRMKAYELLRSPVPTKLDEKREQKTVKLNMTGSMEGYVWSFNQKTLSEAEPITIRKGDNVRVTLTNNTMMGHPFHLHGHFFRVLNGQGDYAPMKHTLYVPPGQTIDIEFYASESKNWFSHCHIGYHMAAGMARVFSYEGSKEEAKEALPKIAHDKFYVSTDTSVHSNMSFGELSAHNTRNIFEIEFDRNHDKDEYDIDAVYLRKLFPALPNLNIRAYAGLNVEQEETEEEEKERTTTGVYGVRFNVPFLEMDLRGDNTGHIRAEANAEYKLIGKEIPFTNYKVPYVENLLVFEGKANTDEEYRTHGRIDFNDKLSFKGEKWSISGGKDSRYGWGAGINLRFNF